MHGEWTWWIKGIWDAIEQLSACRVALYGNGSIMGYAIHTPEGDMYFAYGGDFGDETK